MFKLSIQSGGIQYIHTQPTRQFSASHPSATPTSQSSLGKYTVFGLNSGSEPSIPALQNNIGLFYSFTLSIHF